MADPLQNLALSTEAEKGTGSLQDLELRTESEKEAPAAPQFPYHLFKPARYRMSVLLTM